MYPYLEVRFSKCCFFFFQETIAKLESLLGVETEKSRKLAEQELDGKKQLEITVAHLESKSKEVGELKESMVAMRRDFDLQMQNTVSDARVY